MRVKSEFHGIRKYEISNMKVGDKIMSKDCFRRFYIERLSPSKFRVVNRQSRRMGNLCEPDDVWNYIQYGELPEQECD